MIDFSSSWFLKGLSHPVMTPSHIILLIALGLLLAQQMKQPVLKSLLSYFGIFVLSILIGFSVNHFYANQIEMRLNNELILLVLALSIGLLTLLKQVLPSVIIFLCLIISTLILGFDSSPIMIPGLRSVSMNSWLFGAASGMLGVIALVTLIALPLRTLLNGMILRVLASWIATSAIFVLTLLLAKTGVS